MGDEVAGDGGDYDGGCVQACVFVCASVSARVCLCWCVFVLVCACACVSLC